MACQDLDFSMGITWLASFLASFMLSSF